MQMQQMIALSVFFPGLSLSKFPADHFASKAHHVAQEAAADGLVPHWLQEDTLNR